MIKLETTPEHLPYPTDLTDDDATADELSKRPLDRDSIWSTQRNEHVRIKHLKDTHVANLIAFMQMTTQYHIRSWKKREEFLIVLRAEAEIRGLSKEFLDRAFIPYQHNGKWNLCVNTNDYDKEVGTVS